MQSTGINEFINFSPQIAVGRLVGRSPLLAATRQSYPGFGSGRAAINGTCRPQVPPASSAWGWHPLPDAAPFYYNIFGPKSSPIFPDSQAYSNAC